MTPEDGRDFFKAIQPGLIGSAGGLVGYLVNVVHRGEPWRWPTLLVMYLLVPFFLGHVIESAWPIDATGRPWPGMGGCIAIVGTAGGVVLTVVQDGVVSVLTRWLKSLGDRIK